MITLSDVTVEVAVPGGAPKTILTGISAELTQNRIAIIGANGSGKSTLVRLFNGLVAPTSGKVHVNGLDVSRHGRAVRSQVGFVFTDPLAQLVMATPADDVALGLRAAIRHRTDRLRRATELLAVRGLDGQADQSIYALSGGERQLVALTSVLAVGPSIIVADEPTTLLDLRNRNRLVREFAELPQQIIFATHDLEFAASADRVLVICDGRLGFDGSPTEAIAFYRAAMA